MIEKRDVEYVANLARLKLTDEEKEAFTGQLATVVKYMDQLNEVDTRDVEPTSFVVAEHDPIREDCEKESLSKDDILRNGPSVKRGYFSIPKVIG